MGYMFSGCSSLLYLNLIHFKKMFKNCSNDLKNKIKTQNKNIKSLKYI